MAPRSIGANGATAEDFLRGACSGGGVARVANLSSPEIQSMVMPNPSAEYVQLIWPEIAKTTFTSRFVGASGREVSVVVQTNVDGLLANIRHLTTGVYFWQVVTPGRPPLTFRVMKVE